MESQRHRGHNQQASQPKRLPDLVDRRVATQRAAPRFMPGRCFSSASPNWQLNCKSQCVSRCETEIATRQESSSPPGLVKQPAHQLLGSLRQGCAVPKQASSVTARSARRRSAKRTRAVTVRPGRGQRRRTSRPGRPDQQPPAGTPALSPVSPSAPIVRPLVACARS